MSKVYKQVPFAAIVKCPTKDNQSMVTGNWRYLRPVVDKATCTECKLCWISCPDATVNYSKDDGISFNLEFCKGCGVCSNVCPVGAISRVPELEFDD